MTKTYRSRCTISFTLKVGTSYRRFSFDKLFCGGSAYTTSDKAEQEALEASPYYNNSFFLESSRDDSKKEQVAEEKPQARSIKVNDVVEARDYLMDLFGYKANDLRSRKAIMEAGAEHGIAFEGI